MKRFYTILIVVTLSLVLVGHASEKQYKVTVSVSCKDELRKRSIESHLKRELLSLMDVDVVSPENAEYHINLIAVPIAVPLRNDGQETRGIAIAINYLMEIDVTDWRLKHKYSNKVINLDDITLFLKSHLTLQVGDIEDLDKLCKAIIGTFNSKVLAPLRNLDQQ